MNVAALQPPLPGLGNAIASPADTGSLSRGVLEVVVEADPAPVRTDSIAAAVGADVRAVASERVYLRRDGLVCSRDATPGFVRGMLWQATDAGRSALRAPDLPRCARQALQALADGPLATSQLAGRCAYSLGTARRGTATLRRLGLVRQRPGLGATAPSPNGGAEHVHEITDHGRRAQRRLHAHQPQQLTL